MAMNSREEELLAELETTRGKLTEMKRSIGNVFKAAWLSNGAGEKPAWITLNF